MSESALLSARKLELARVLKSEVGADECLSRFSLSAQEWESEIADSELNFDRDAPES